MEVAVWGVLLLTLQAHRTGGSLLYVYIINILHHMFNTIYRLSV